MKLFPKPHTSDEIINTFSNLDSSNDLFNIFINEMLVELFTLSSCSLSLLFIKDFLSYLLKSFSFLCFEYFSNSFNSKMLS